MQSGHVREPTVLRPVWLDELGGAQLWELPVSAAEGGSIHLEERATASLAYACGAPLDWPSCS